MRTGTSRPILGLLGLLGLIGLFALAAVARSAPAQTTAATAAEGVEPSGLERADAMLGDGRYHDALLLLEELARERPDDVEVRWRLGKACIDLGEAIGDEKQQRVHFARAVTELREAVRLDPQSRDAVFNLAIAVGRDGLARGAKAKVRASREVKELAERTIEIDPGFDGAYHLLGRWHREIKSLGFFTRTLVKVVYGGFPDASYEQALRYFEQAQSLHPRMAHLLEIGICHEALGDREKARAAYRQVISMEGDHADAWMMRAEAQRRLES